MPKVEFLFDFGSPNAYLSHLVIPAIEARIGMADSIPPISMSPRCPPRPKLCVQPGGGAIEVA